MGGGLGDYARYGSIGISWVLTTAIYLYLGYRGGQWLDTRFGTAPVFLVLGMVMAIGLSLLTLTKDVMALDRTLRKRGTDGQGHRTGVNRERKHFPYSGEVRGPDEPADPWAGGTSSEESHDGGTRAR